MSDSLQPHGLQHIRLPCASPTPGANSNSCPSHQWCHPTISSSVVPYLLLPSIFPTIRVFFNESVLCSRWSKCWSFSFSISPSNEYSGLISFKMDWFDLLSVQGTLKHLSNTTVSTLSFLYTPTLTSINDYWKDYSFDYTDLCWQSDVSAFQCAVWFVIAFLQRSKFLLI